MFRIRFAHECWSAFRQGVARPSLVALLVSLGTFILISVSVCLYFDSGAFSGEGYRRLMTTEWDTYALVTARALEIRSSLPAEFAVVILGTSTTLRGIASEAELAGLVAAKTGLEPAVYNLCTDAQNCWEMAALVNCFPADFQGVLVIGVTPGVLANGIEQGPGNGYASLATVMENPRLGVQTEAFDGEARRAGIRIPRRVGVYALDNAHFLLARRWTIGRSLFRPGLIYRDPLDAPWMSEVNSEDFWRKEVAKFSTLKRYFEENRDLNCEVIKRLVSDLKARGNVAPLLMVSPINPRCYSEPIGKEFYPAYKAFLRQFARQNAWSHLVISEAADLAASDFVDFEGHIGNRVAREKTTEVLASRVSQLYLDELVERDE